MVLNRLRNIARDGARSGACAVVLMSTAAVPGVSHAVGEAGPAELRARVVQVLPHDPASFTEGLEVHSGTVYETSGHYGRSWVQRAELSSGRVLRRVPMPAAWFGEGLTRAPGGLWQLTWREGTAALRDPRTLAERRRVRHLGEGWGLCHDRPRHRLVMSDGTGTLALRDPASFRLLGRMAVHGGERTVTGLNELECAGRHLWANLWPTDDIARIDPATGRVTAYLRVGALPGVPSSERPPGRLNGIAVDPASKDLLITGKNWPHIFRVRPRPVR